jgi:hypothetical protein
MAEGYAAGARLGKPKSQSEPMLGVSGCARYKCRMKYCALVLATVFCAASLFAEESPASIAKSELSSLLTIYKDVHHDPELFDRRIADLRADREGTEGRDDLVVLVRTNMDALPEQEESGLLCGLASAPTEFNAIPKGAPPSSVAHNSASACLLVE